MDAIPTPDFAVPYAAPMSARKKNFQSNNPILNKRIFIKFILAKHKAAVTPRKPKNGAEVGQVSLETVVVDILSGVEERVFLGNYK